MLTSPLFEHIKNKLNRALGIRLSMIDLQRVYGGDINQTFILKTDHGNFFVKANSSGYNDMFEKEAKGLKLLKSVTEDFVPRVFVEGSFGEFIFLVLENIPHGHASPLVWKAFAEKLAALHKHTDAHFGLTHDNYIGSLHQKNKRCATWAEFYCTHRLLHLTNVAAEQKLFTATDITMMEGLCKKLGDIFPAEPASLLHGDLWNGNYLVNEQGNAVIFDPAVYYGHREMDIAMTLLFGGFDKSFYQYYNEVFPLEKNWMQRMDVCQLYPLMVHLILFGGHYYDSVKTILKKYN